MLLYLHIKNYALIEDAEVEFSRGLNIITGETGAGKSVLMGSVLLCLGGKTKADVIRGDEEYAYVELHFLVENERQRELLKELDIETEDDIVVISKKITRSRSVGKICGVTVNSDVLRQVADVFLDVYGQHDYQNLLQESKHIEILDGYAGEKLSRSREEVSERYTEYAALKKEAASLSEDEEKRKRDLDFLAYELKEIEDAHNKWLAEDAQRKKAQQDAANARGEGVINSMRLDVN